MKKIKYNPLWYSRMIFLFCGLLIVSLGTQGCEPLRKKFTRRKKKDKYQKEIIPLLEPIEYPDKKVSSAHAYKHHLSLAQVWFKELIFEMEEKGSKKRKLYLMDQLLLNLEAMKEIVSGNSREDIGEIQTKLQKIREDISSPVLSQNVSTLQMKLMSIEKKMRRVCRFSAVEDQLGT